MTRQFVEQISAILARGVDVLVCADVHGTPDANSATSTANTRPDSGR